MIWTLSAKTKEIWRVRVTLVSTLCSYRDATEYSSTENLNAREWCRSTTYEINTSVCLFRVKTHERIKRACRCSRSNYSLAATRQISSEKLTVARINNSPEQRWKSISALSLPLLDTSGVLHLIDSQILFHQRYPSWKEENRVRETNERKSFSRANEFYCVAREDDGSPHVHLYVK